MANFAPDAPILTPAFEPDAPVMSDFTPVQTARMRSAPDKTYTVKNRTGLMWDYGTPQEQMTYDQMRTNFVPPRMVQATDLKYKNAIATAQAAGDAEQARRLNDEFTLAKAVEVEQTMGHVDPRALPWVEENIRAQAREQAKQTGDLSSGLAAGYEAFRHNTGQVVGDMWEGDEARGQYDKNVQLQLEDILREEEAGQHPLSTAAGGGAGTVLSPESLATMAAGGAAGDLFAQGTALNRVVPGVVQGLGNAAIMAGQQNRLPTAGELAQQTAIGAGAGFMPNPIGEAAAQRAALSPTWSGFAANKAAQLAAGAANNAAVMVGSNAAMAGLEGRPYGGADVLRDVVTAAAMEVPMHAAGGFGLVPHANPETTLRNMDPQAINAALAKAAGHALAPAQPAEAGERSAGDKQGELDAGEVDQAAKTLTPVIRPGGQPGEEAAPTPAAPPAKSTRPEPPAILLKEIPLADVTGKKMDANGNALVRVANLVQPIMARGTPEQNVRLAEVLESLDGADPVTIVHALNQPGMVTPDFDTLNNVRDAITAGHAKDLAAGVRETEKYSQALRDWAATPAGIAENAERLRVVKIADLRRKLGEVQTTTKRAAYGHTEDVPRPAQDIQADRDAIMQRIAELEKGHATQPPAGDRTTEPVGPAPAKAAEPAAPAPPAAAEPATVHPAIAKFERDVRQAYGDDTITAGEADAQQVAKNPQAKAMQTLAAAWGVKVSFLETSLPKNKTPRAAWLGNGHVGIDIRHLDHAPDALLMHEIYHELTRNNPAVADTIDTFLHKYMPTVIDHLGQTYLSDAERNGATELARRLREDPAGLDDEGRARALALVVEHSGVAKEIVEENPGLWRKIVKIAQDLNSRVPKEMRGMVNATSHLLKAIERVGPVLEAKEKARQEAAGKPGNSTEIPNSSTGKPDKPAEKPKAPEKPELSTYDETMAELKAEREAKKKAAGAASAGTKGGNAAPPGDAAPELHSPIGHNSDGGVVYEDSKGRRSVMQGGSRMPEMAGADRDGTGFETAPEKASRIKKEQAAAHAPPITDDRKHFAVGVNSEGEYVYQRDGARYVLHDGFRESESIRLSGGPKDRAGTKFETTEEAAKRQPADAGGQKQAAPSEAPAGSPPLDAKAQRAAAFQAAMKKASDEGAKFEQPGEAGQEQPDSEWLKGLDVPALRALRKKLPTGWIRWIDYLLAEKRPNDKSTWMSSIRRELQDRSEGAAGGEQAAARFRLIRGQNHAQIEKMAMEALAKGVGETASPDWRPNYLMPEDYHAFEQPQRAEDDLPDEAVLRPTIAFMEGLVGDGVTKFSDMVREVHAVVPEHMAKLDRAIEIAWKILQRKNPQLEAAGKVKDILAENREDKPPEDKPLSPDSLSSHFAQQFKAGKVYKTIVEAREEAGAQLGRKIEPGTADAKLVDEAVEVGAVAHARSLVEEGRKAGKDPRAIYGDLVKFYETQQPGLNVRTSESIEQQAYSTPLPLAFLAEHLAGVTKDSRVYEPTAGNGALLIGVDPEKATVNELNAARRANLKQAGFHPTGRDASEVQVFPAVDVVLANPPFGAVRENGAVKTFTMRGTEGKQTREVDHAISMEALSHLKEGGTAVLILGAKGSEHLTSDDPKKIARRQAYSAGGQYAFYKALYEQFNVTDHFTVHGDLYGKQGAKFPVDVLVIKGRGAATRELPWAKPPEVYNSWQELSDHGFQADQTPHLAPERPDDSLVPPGDGPDPGERPAGAGGPGGDGLSDLPGAPGAADQLDGPAGNGRPGTGGAGAGEGGPALDELEGPAGGRAGAAGAGARPDAAPGAESHDVSDEAAAERGGGAPGEGDEPGDVAGKPETDVQHAGVKSEGENEHQVPYEPATGEASEGILIPRNLQTPVREALAAVKQARGDLNQFVADELGLPVPHVRKVFNSEQRDALAMAIHNHKLGAGFILGDQTGVGKGRVVAGMMVYAINQGHLPIFVTATPDLYADMMRDIINIGASSVERPFRVLVTNSGLSGKSKPIQLPDGRELRTGSGHQQLFESAVNSLVAGEGLRDSAGVGYDAIFTTYHQLQSVSDGTPTWRNAALMAVRERAYFVLDESHLAGGTEKGRGRGGAAGAVATGPGGRAGFVRNMIREAQGVLYSSATFAKRPSVMDLYFWTDIAKAITSPHRLVELFKRGGVPLQQAVSGMLAKAGQMIRRERTYDGVSFEPHVVKVDAQLTDELSGAFRAIRDFDEAKKDAVANAQDAATSEGGGLGHDNAVGEASIISTNFSSIMWNVVDQSLLSLKLDHVAEQAIAAIGRGEKPVIALASTMQAALENAVEVQNAQAGNLRLRPGDPINTSVRDLLLHYLERSREIRTRNPGERTVTVVRLTDEQLGPEGVAAYNAAKAFIQNSGMHKLPISPIDYLRGKIERAGFKVGEITGRTLGVDYAADGKQTYKLRSSEELGSAGKQKTIRAYNTKPEDGGLHALIINQSGATGVSLHASPDNGNDLAVRHMIIAQPEKNIDTFMQMLGRIHRTGQVALPRYTLLLSDAPAENRPAAVLVKKLASLNATVTAARQGAVHFADVPDIVNEVGDSVVADYLWEHQEDHILMGEPLDTNRTGTSYDPEDASTTATGKAALLPIARQQAFWEGVSAAFKERIAELDATGRNPLVARTLDLKATTIEKQQLTAGEAGSTSPFTSPSELERVSMNRLGKPLTSDEVRARVAQGLGVEPDALRDTFDHINTEDDAARRWHDELVAGLRQRHQAYMDELTQPATPGGEMSVGQSLQADRAQRQAQHVSDIIRQFGIGKKVALSVNEVGDDAQPNQDMYVGVVTAIKPATGANPVAPSQWKIKLALADPMREIEIPFSRLNLGRDSPYNLSATRDGEAVAMTGHGVMEGFDKGQRTSREQRFMATGNILSAFEHLNRGQIMNFTDDQGATRQGILMPRNFRPSDLATSAPVRIATPQEALDRLRQRQQLITEDRALRITMDNDTGRWTVSVERSRRLGGRYFLNPQLRAAVGRDFVSVGNEMRVSGDSERSLQRILQAMADQQMHLYRPPDAAGGGNGGRGGGRGGRGGRGGGGQFEMPTPEGNDFLDAEAEERYRANRGAPREPAWDKIKKRIVDAYRQQTRHFEHLSGKVAADAQLADRLRLLEAEHGAADHLAQARMTEWSKGLTPKEYDQFGRGLILPDLVKDIEAGLYEGKPGDVPLFGRGEKETRTTAEIAADILKEHADLAAKMTPAVEAAMAQRNKFVKDMATEMVRLNLLPETVLDDDRYFHRQVMAHLMAREHSVGGYLGDAKLRKQGFQMARQGGGDFNTAYEQAEHEYLTGAMRQVATASALREIEKDFDMSPQLRAAAKEQNERGVYPDEATYKRVQKIRSRLAEGGVGGKEARELHEELEQIDPLLPFRRRIATGFDLLAKAVEQDKPIIPPQFLHNGKLAEGDIWGFLNWASRSEKTSDETKRAVGAIFKAIDERKTFVKETLGSKFADWQKLIPAGHTTWSPKAGTQFARVLTIPEQTIVKIMKGQKGLEESDVRAMYARVPGKELVLPDHFATQLDHMHVRDPQLAVTKFAQDATNAWKLYTLLNPLRVAKYNFNNFSGDLDVVLAADPKVLGHFKRTLLDLIAYQRGTASPEVKAQIEEAMGLGVLDSGRSLHDITDISSTGVFKKLTQQAGRHGPGDWIKWYLDKAGGMTSLRENVLRLSAYRRALEQVTQGKHILWASNASELRSVKTPQRRAAKLARELLGDYGNLSVAGQKFRRQLMPFYSWMEINAPRYVRLLRNAAAEGRLGRTGAVAAGMVGLKVAGLAARAVGLYALVHLYNKLRYPDEDDGFKDGHLGLILGMDSRGHVHTLRFEGALSDALEWVGLNKIPGHLEDGDVVEAMKDLYHEPSNKFYQALNPAIKGALDVAGHHGSYPDVWHPHPVRDMGEHLAGIGGQLPTYLYRAAKGIPQPAIQDQIMGLMAQDQDPGQNAYGEVRGWAEKWLNKNGHPQQGGEPTERSNAFYYYKQALRYGQPELARKWMAEYQKAGGTAQKMQQSQKAAYPLGAVPLNLRNTFLGSLTPEQRRSVERSIRWYNQQLVQQGAGAGP